MVPFFFNWMAGSVAALLFSAVCIAPYRNTNGFRGGTMVAAALLFAAADGAFSAWASGFGMDMYVLAFLICMLPGAILFAWMLQRNAWSLRWCAAPGMVSALAVLSASGAIVGLMSGVWRTAQDTLHFLCAVIFAAASAHAVFLSMRKIADAAIEGVPAGVRGVWIQAAALLLVELTAMLLGRPPVQLLLPVLCVCGCCAAYIEWGRLCETAKNAAMEKEREQSLERVVEIQRRQYAELSEQIENARTARHDLHHHMAAVQQYIQTGDRENLREYLEVYGKALPEEERISWCRNRAADSVARYYLGRAKAEGVSVDAVLNIGEDAAIPTPDLCVVLGNALENALEAVCAEGVRNRMIRVRVEDQPGYMTIVVGNGYSGKPLRSADDGFLSAKREGRTGIGTASIRSIAAKYGGTAAFEAGRELFKTSIILFKQNS